METLLYLDEQDAEERPAEGRRELLALGNDGEFFVQDDDDLNWRGMPEEGSEE